MIVRVAVSVRLTEGELECVSDADAVGEDEFVVDWLMELVFDIVFVLVGVGISVGEVVGSSVAVDDPEIEADGLFERVTLDDTLCE